MGVRSAGKAKPARTTDNRCCIGSIPSHPIIELLGPTAEKWPQNNKPELGAALNVGNVLRRKYPFHEPEEATRGH